MTNGLAFDEFNVRNLGREPAVLTFGH